MRRCDLAPLAGLAAVAVLAGCAALPRPVPPASRSAPVVTTAQAQRIVASTQDLLARSAASGAAWDPNLAATRLTGPALQWAAPAPNGQLAPIVPGTGGGAATVIAPQVGAWPRAFAVIDSTALDGSGPLLSVYVSESAQLPYRMWGAVPLAQELPGFGPPDVAVGDPQRATADEAADGPAGGPGLADVVAHVPDRYADVLRDGDRSAHAPEFETDGYAAALRDRIEAERTRMGPELRTTVTHEVLRQEGQPDVVFAAVAGNGDALVVAGFVTTVTATAGPGLRGVTTRWIAALAFVVPAAEGNIRVVGAADAISMPPNQPLDQT